MYSCFFKTQKGNFILRKITAQFITKVFATGLQPDSLVVINSDP